MWTFETDTWLDDGDDDVIVELTPSIVEVTTTEEEYVEGETAFIRTIS